MSKKKTAFHGGNAVALSLIVLAILVVLQALSARHHLRTDVTENNRYSLSQQSIKVLQSLENDLEIIAFMKDDGSREPARDLFDQYAYVSPRFSHRFVDPDRKPGQANRYEVTLYGTVVLASGERTEKVVAQPGAGLTEQDLTNAMVKLTREGTKKVYFLTGHGERSRDDVEPSGYGLLRDRIEQANYATEDLFLMRAERVPEDASVLIVPGPLTPLLEGEEALLRAYIARGGKLLTLLDSESDPAYSRFLAEYGFQVGDNVLIDKMSRMFGAEYTMPVVSLYGTHPIVEGFALVSLFSVARSVGLADGLPEGITGEVLASSGENSWAETDLETLNNLQEAEFQEDQDLLGPVPLAAAVSVPRDAPETGEEPGAAGGATPGAIVTFGDADFADNTHVAVQGNGDLILNAVSWLAEEEDLIAIRPKGGGSSPLLLNPTQSTLAFVLPTVVVPGLFLALGIAVLLRRRRRT